MNPNERDAEPPAPDATAEPEWDDPWSWRAYPDDPPEPAAPDAQEQAEETEPAHVEASPGSDDEAPPEDAESPVSEEPAEAVATEPSEAAEPPAPAAAAEAEEAVESAPAEPSEVAEAPATAEEPAGPAEEPGAGGEAVGLSDWDERVRLLERVEPGEPAEFREPGDFWDPGASDEATEAAADTLEIPRAPRAEPPAALVPPLRPPEPRPVEPAPPARPGQGSRPASPGEPLAAPPWWPPPPTPTLRPPQPAPGHWPPPPSVGQGGPPALPLPVPLQPGPPQAEPPRSLSPRPAPPGGWVRPVGAEPPWGFQQAPAPARPARTRRRGWIIVLAIVAALAVTAVQLVQLGVLRRPDSAAPRGAQLAAPNPPAPSGPGASASTLSPQAQVVRLLTSRSSALLRHDRAAFLATVDRRRGSFYRSQAALFDRMVTVPFASFSYSVSDPLRDVGSDQARQRYSPTVVSMFPVEASFGFRGQDASPFVAHYFYTFAVTASGWRIAGQDDVPKPLQSDVEIWDAGPVQTVSTSRTLVVFHPGGADLARRLLAVAERGYAQVAASWSSNWDKKVVILVPRDQREAQRLVRSRDLSDVAAVTSSAIEAGPLHRLLGNRIIVNTSLVKGYRTLDLQVVLTHEMTHVATRGIGVGVPLYLVEGFADYTALRPLGAPVRLTRPSLALAVRTGRFKGKLPTRSQLVGSDAALAYDEGSTFCLWVASTFGEARLQTLYSSFGDLTGDADRQDEDLRFRRVLGVSRATAEARWAAFIRGAM